MLGGLLGGIGSALAGGLLGGLGSGGDQVVQTQNDLPEWLKPYYTGGGDGRTGMIPGQLPINQDYLYWNQMAGMGMPIGPPPPLYADNPWYTGENVFAPPGTFLSPMQNLATNPPQFGMGGLLGGGAGPTGGAGPDPGAAGIFQYPSQQVPQGGPPMPGPAPVPTEATPDGLSPLDQYILNQEFRKLQDIRASDPEASIMGGISLRDLSPEGREFLKDKDIRRYARR